MNWKKLGIVYAPSTDLNRPTWRWNYAQGVNALLYDSFVRVYFCCREKPDALGRTVSRVCYADLDRGDPTRLLRVAEKPCLALGSLGTFDEFGTYPFTVIRKAGKIYGYYGGVTRCESVPFNVAIGCAISEDDGETFQRMGKGPVLSYSLDEPFVVCSPKVRCYDGRWYLFYSAGRAWTPGKEGARPEIYYKLRMATSEDGIRWVPCHRDIMPDKLGATEAQACGDVLWRNGKYHMFFSYRCNEDFRRNKKNAYRIGYATSMDLLRWTRNDSRAGIDVSPDPSAFDSEMVAYPHVFEVQNGTYMLYLGNEVGKEGFGIAKLEGDLD